jgi:hypothetical protein
MTSEKILNLDKIFFLGNLFEMIDIIHCISSLKKLSTFDGCTGI